MVSFARTVVVFALLSICVRGQTGRPADLILRNGAICTMDAARSWASAVAIAGGRIVYVGTDSGALKLAAPSTKSIDLGGRMVLPGFHDSHVHLEGGGTAMNECQLNGLTTPDAVYDAIRKYAAANPGKTWLTGSGWELPVFPAATPRREQLDAVAGDRPAYMTAADGHSGWANSKALAIAGITKDTPDPPRGRIERDPETKEPNGTLRESAMQLVTGHIPAVTKGERAAALKRGASLANSFGITSIQEAAAGDSILAAYQTLDQRDQLTVRAVAAMQVYAGKSDDQVAELAGKRTRLAGRRFRATAAKIFSDGVIEPGTAALLEPYLNRGGSRGELNFEPERLARLVTRLDRERFQVHIHAIGDHAVRVSLDAFEAAQKANGRRDARHHIAHLELIEPADIPRFREMGVIANFQPLWAYADPYIRDLTLPVLGPARSRWLYPIGSVVKTGATLAAGSDWPVSSLNPLEAIQVAVTRRGPTDPEGPAWIPEETIDLSSVLAAYTINGAYLNGQEKETGSIEVGKAGDLIVLDRNLFKIRAEKIHETKVLLTLLDGREVFRAAGF